MQRSGRIGRWVSDVMLGAGVLVLGMGGILAAIAHPARSLSPVETETVDVPILVAQRLECRQIAPERGASFYSTLPQYRRAASDILPRGSRVSVDVTSGSILAPDGQYYQFVTYPYGSSNTVTGYIPLQTQTSNGVRNTFEQCRRRMW